jgi:uncharacterized membrane protein YfcA
MHLLAVAIAGLVITTFLLAMSGFSPHLGNVDGALLIYLLLTAPLAAVYAGAYTMRHCGDLFRRLWGLVIILTALYFGTRIYLHCAVLID